MEEEEYTAELMMERIAEAESVSDGIMIAAHIIEHHVNRMLAYSGIDMSLVSKVALSPEQRFSYALGVCNFLDWFGEMDEERYFFFGMVNRILRLRSLLVKLSPQELDEEVYRLYMMIGRDKAWRDVFPGCCENEEQPDPDSANDIVEMWSAFACPVCYFMINIANGVETDYLLLNNGGYEDAPEEETDGPAPNKPDPGWF